VSPKGQCYLLLTKEKPALQEFLEKNLKSERIRPSTSPFASPFFFRAKLGTQELRAIQDYRKFNEVTVLDQYPLPLISVILENLKESKGFLKMDLHWGFNNIRIRAGDEEKVAFVMTGGLFEPTVMQFDLCNALSTFQRMVDQILNKEIASRKVQAYVDDILIHTETREEYHYWTRRVLAKLQDNQLFCRETKCRFKEEVVDFLGV
jgi:hypothetical protein